MKPTEKQIELVQNADKLYCGSFEYRFADLMRLVQNLKELGCQDDKPIVFGVTSKEEEAVRTLKAESKRDFCGLFSE